MLVLVLVLASFEMVEERGFRVFLAEPFVAAGVGDARGVSEGESRELMSMTEGR